MWTHELCLSNVHCVQINNIKSIQTYMDISLKWGAYTVRLIHILWFGNGSNWGILQGNNTFIPTFLFSAFISSCKIVTTRSISKCICVTWKRPPVNRHGFQKHATAGFESICDFVWCLSQYISCGITCLNLTTRGGCAMQKWLLFIKRKLSN